MSSPNTADKVKSRLRKAKPKAPPKPKTTSQLLPHTKEDKTGAPRVTDPDFRIRMVPSELVLFSYGSGKEQKVYAMASVNPADHHRLLEAFPGTSQKTLTVRLITQTKTGNR